MDIADIMKSTVDWMADLCKVVQFMKLYPETHPYIQTGLDKAFESLQRLEQKLPKVTIGIRDDGLLCEDRSILDIPKTVEDFLVKLRKKNFNSIIINRGVSRDELRALVRLMSAKDEDVVKDGRVRPEVLEPFDKLELNEIEYKIVNEEDAILAEMADKAFLNYLLGLEQNVGEEGEWVDFDLLSMIKGDPKSVAGILVQAMQKQLQDQGAEGLPEDQQAPLIQDTTLGFFNRMRNNMVGNTDVDVSVLKDNMFAIFNALPPDAQKAVFGENFEEGKAINLEKLLTEQPISEKAQLLLNEMHLHAGEDHTDKDGKVAKDMKQVLVTDGELVEIAEYINTHMSDIDEEERKQRMASLFGFLQSNVEFDPSSQALIYLAEPDKEIREAYNTVLLTTNSHVVSFEDGTAVFEEVKKKLPHMIIMDIKLPKMNGLELISRLKKLPGKEKVPLIINTRDEASKNEFEVMTYPEKMLFGKPMSKEELKTAIKAYSPPPKEVHKESTQLEEDLRKANEVQHKLLPQSVPDIPGFDVAAFYVPCKDIGGDYYDIFQIDDDNVGLICADVAGKGISGAMIMVMVRSLLRTIYRQSLSTKEILVRLNEMIVPDIRQGMFVSAMYAILNIPEKRLTVSNAGHNALLIARNDIPHQFITMPGMVMGLRSGDMFQKLMTEETIYMDYGDKFLLFTDGVTESFNPSGEEYQEYRLGAVVDNFGRFAQSAELVQHIYNDILRFENGAARFDDITILCVKCKDFEI